MLNDIKTIWTNIKQWWMAMKTLATKDLTELWSEYHTVFILFGTIIVYIKFKDTMINFVVASSKRFFHNIQMKSQSSQLKEDAENKQADQLVAEAQALSTVKPSDPKADWYKKED